MSNGVNDELISAVIDIDDDAERQQPKFAPAVREEVRAENAPKRITNAQTVCNERNQKGKLCKGFLKQLGRDNQAAHAHLRGDDVLYQCQTCRTFYMGPLLGHLRDPQKMQRYVQKELTQILQAAGGTLPAFKRTETGALVPVKPKTHAPYSSPQDSPVSADAHRSAAEAQAATGQASAAPLSEAAAMASPAAGAEKEEDLAPDASAEEVLYEHNI
jgi:hypothetical protein